MIRLAVPSLLILGCALAGYAPQPSTTTTTTTTATTWGYQEPGMGSMIGGTGYDQDGNNMNQPGVAGHGHSGQGGN